PGTATARLHALRLAAGATPVGASARPARGLRVLPVTLGSGCGRARGLLIRAARLCLRACRGVRVLPGSRGRVRGVALPAMVWLRSVSHWGLPVARWLGVPGSRCALVSLCALGPDRKGTRLNSSHVSIPYAVFCLK